jgi:hypothetical protein
MIRVARLMFPHDGVDDIVFAEILDNALSATAADDSFASTLDAAERALGDEFSTLSEDAQIAALESRQGETFFSSIFAEVRARLYDHPACWQVIGYGGPSFQDGGYLHRGAGEIDWLAEGE